MNIIIGLVDYWNDQTNSWTKLDQSHVVLEQWFFYKISIF